MGRLVSTPANVLDAKGLSFACRPGCGFCCTATPLVLPHEASALGALVVRAEDGTLRIPIQGLACSSLRADMSCGSYENRPAVCHLYPFQVHAGRRLQVSVSLACPGVAPGESAGAMEEGAQEAARRALAQPGAAEMAARAKESFGEFDRRMKEWGVHATSDQLRAAFLPHLRLLAHPEALPAFFAGLEPGDLTLGARPALDVEALFHEESEHDLPELLVEAAADAFDDASSVLWVEARDLAWTRVEHKDDQVVLHRQLAGADRATIALNPEDVPLEWDDAASDALADYLKRLAHRDHTEGAAAWLVDASGYQVTPAAAYGRVLGEAALQVVLRAGLLAAEDGHERIDAEGARRGIAAYETSYHSLPTLGSVL